LALGVREAVSCDPQKQLLRAVADGLWGRDDQGGGRHSSGEHTTPNVPRGPWRSQLERLCGLARFEDLVSLPATQVSKREDGILPLASASVSGLYVRREQSFSLTGVQSVVADTVRLDVDGYYPLMRASGLCYLRGLNSVAGSVYWISDELTYQGDGVWYATIRRRYPDPGFSGQISASA
jgi:hypothetical protein